MTSAETKRLEVLRQIGDVVGDRQYLNSAKSRSVRAEVARLLRDGLIEPCDRDGEPGYRRTLAGDEAVLGEGRDGRP